MEWPGRGLPHTFPTQPFPTQFFYLAVSEFCPFIINQWSSKWKKLKLFLMTKVIFKTWKQESKHSNPPKLIWTHGYDFSEFYTLHLKYNFLIWGHKVRNQWDKFFFWKYSKLLLSRFSRVQLCVTPEMAAHQAPPYLWFSRHICA